MPASEVLGQFPISVNQALANFIEIESAEETPHELERSQKYRLSICAWL
jgi:hypothetical protein